MLSGELESIPEAVHRLLEETNQTFTKGGRTKREYWRGLSGAHVADANRTAKGWDWSVAGSPTHFLRLVLSARK